MGNAIHWLVTFFRRYCTFKIKVLFLFLEKYEYIGRLLRPGELSRNYSDGETEGESSEEEDVSSRPKAE